MKSEEVASGHNVAAKRGNRGTRRVEVNVKTPRHFGATTQVRLRVPRGKVLQSARVNGHPWTLLDPEQEVITLPPGALRRDGTAKVIAYFR